MLVLSLEEQEVLDLLKLQAHLDQIPELMFTLSDHRVSIKVLTRIIVDGYLNISPFWNFDYSLINNHRCLNSTAVEAIYFSLPGKSTFQQLKLLQSQYASENFLQRVAANEQQESGNKIIQQVLRHPNCPMSLLLYFAKRSLTYASDVRVMCLTHHKLPVSFIKKHFNQFFWIFVQNTRCPSELLLKSQEQHGVNLDGSQVQGNGIEHSLNILRNPIEHSLNILRNPNCPQELLEQVSVDSKLCGAAISNRQCPQDLVLAFYRKHDYRPEILKNPQCPLDILWKIMATEEELTRLLVVGHPSVPQKLLLSALGDSLLVKARALLNPRMPHYARQLVSG